MFRAIVLILLVVWKIPIYAVVPASLPTTDSITSNSGISVAEYPGENINLYNGSVKWQVVETVLPGPNGLDLILSRSFNHRGEGRWKFDIPEIDIGVEKGRYYPRCCTRKDRESGVDGVRVSDNQFDRNLLHIPGHDPITIYGWHSTDRNWKVQSCTPAKRGSRSGGAAASITISCNVLGPRGRSYELSQTYRYDDWLSYRRNAAYDPVVVVSKYAKVSDIFGNYIEYNQTESKLDITSSDGRRATVNFVQLADGFEGHNRNYTPAFVSVLDDLTVYKTDGSSDLYWKYDSEHVYRYPSWCSIPGDISNRRDCSRNTNTVYGGARISSVTNPDASVITYNYFPSSSPFDLADDKPTIYLNKITTNHGLEILYTLSNHTNSPHRVLRKRVISDPNGDSILNYETNYTYGPYAHDRYTIIESPNNKLLIRYGRSNTTESGRPTIRQVFEVGANISTDEPLRTHEYKYISEGNSQTGISNLWVDGSFKYPALSEVLVDGRYKTEFSDRDTTFRLWGKKRETTGIKSRVTTYDYWNQEGSATEPRFVGLLDNQTITGDGKNWVVNNTFNDNGQMTQSIVEGVQSNFTYDSNGNLSAYSYQNHTGTHSVTYGNYKSGIAQTETYPDQTQVTRSVNDDGTIAWEQDRSGNRIDFSYDVMGRVTSISPEGVDTTRVAYAFNTPYSYSDSSGAISAPRNLVTITRDNAPSYQKQVVLDALNRKVLTKELGVGVSPIYQRFDYDDRGYQTFSSLPSASSGTGIGIQKDFDALGRVISLTNTGDNSSTTTNYRYLSDYEVQSAAMSICGVNCFEMFLNEFHSRSIVEVIDSNNKLTTYQNTSFGNPDDSWTLSAIQPEAISTSMNYDVLGNLTSVSRYGVTRLYTYEPGSSRLSSITEPERGVVNFTYDQSGNLRTKQVGTAPLATYSYDENNRLSSVSYSDATAATDYTYWGDGSLKTMANDFVSRSYNYTPFGALDEETISVGSGSDIESFTLDYGYNSAGFANSITYPNGMKLNYGVDDLGRITSVGTSTKDFATNVQYHPNSTLSRMTYGNGVTTEYTLNNRQIVKEIEAVKGIDPKMRLGFTYDGELNVKSITDHLNSINSVTAITYDGVNRLATANSPLWGNASFSYDVKGNILTKNMGSLGSLSYTYNSKNQLGTVSGSHARTYQYDQFGNATTNGVHDMIYNAASRMIQVNDATTGDTLIDYAYDGDGIKALEVKQDSALYTIYNQAGDLLFEKDYVSNVETSYVRLGNQTIAKINAACEDKDTDEDGIPDCTELAIGLDPINSNDANYDRDGDGLSNKYELQIGTNLDNPDTDGDGMDDNWERAFGLDPNDPVDANIDTDGDGFTNYEEYQAGTSPKLAIDISALLPAILHVIMH
ncbi:MAG: hypothetical protein MK096_15065 [Oleiphilaceae bacterium]|nr:hypothetical protein [Oleiphilaceae bacterium]